MFKYVVTIISAAICLASGPIWADDLGGILSRCQQASGRMETTITLEHKDGTWQVTAVRAQKSDLSDADLQQLLLLADIQSLELSAVCPALGRVTPTGMHKIASFEHLRRLSITFRLPRTGIEAVSSLRDLQELELASWGPEMDIGLGPLRSLGALRRLDLSNQSVTDASLADIVQLKALEHLAFDGSNVTAAGLGGLGDLKNLRSLGVSCTAATGAGLARLKALPRLEHLSLRQEVSCGPAWDQVDLSSWRNLRSLTLQCSALREGAEVRLPERLTRLCISMRLAHLVGPLPTHLQSLTLFIGESDSIDMALVKSLRELRELTLVGGVNTAVKALTGTESFHILVLSALDDELTDGEMKRIGQLARLEALDITRMRKVTDGGMAQLRSLKELRDLKLSGIGEVSGEGFSCLRELKQLRALSVGCGFQPSVDTILDHVRLLPELESLSIGGATLTDAGLKKLANLKKLSVLDLTDCQGYSEEGLAALMDALPNLKMLKRSYRPRAEANGFGGRHTQ